MITSCRQHPRLAATAISFATANHDRHALHNLAQLDVQGGGRAQRSHCAVAWGQEGGAEAGAGSHGYGGQGPCRAQSL